MSVVVRGCCGPWSLTKNVCFYDYFTFLLVARSAVFWAICWNATVNCQSGGAECQHNVVCSVLHRQEGALQPINKSAPEGYDVLLCQAEIINQLIDQVI